MSRSLLLKGLVGVGVVAGAGSLVVFREKIFGVGEEGENLSGFKHKELIEKVGLECGLSEDEIADNTIKECTVKDGGTINVEVEGKKEEGVSFTSKTSKLKVSKDEKYSGGLRFVVDSGDLALTKDGGTLTHFQKLEQFETYEVKKVREKFYLKRRTEAKEGKKDALGLGKCILPKAGDTECSLTTEGEIKKVKFQGHDDGVTVKSGTVNLKISRVNDSITDFTDNYRFTFTFPQDLTINGKNLKANTPYDFKIKKHDNSNTLTLEKAWTEDNVFAKKAGLDCTTSSQCSVLTESKLNVRVGDKKKEGITGKTGTGKIKMETDKPGYNQGLKFSITTGDVSLTGGTGADNITKLEELETYEITEEGGKFYLSIKTSKKEAIKSSLSIPEGCFKTLNTPCVLDAESFKNINFDGKSSPSSNGTVNLTISKADSTDFPLGYKFTFETEKEATIATGNNSKIIKANTPTDFKIKKGENGASLTLEKAWTASTLGAKVGFQNCNTGKNECTINAGKLNVKQGDKNDTGLSKSGSGSAKIKVKKDQEGYNQGFKFTVEGGNINLTGSKQTDDYYKVTSLEEYETYEVKEVNNEWYLVRKNEAIVFLKKALGFEFCSGDSFGSLFTCDIKDPNNLKNIKFEGKDKHSNWPTGAINVQLAIEKETNGGGLKFTFNKKDDSYDSRGNVNSSTLCIPTGVRGGSVDLKKNTGGVEYTIKKSGSSLSLVKKS